MQGTGMSIPLSPKQQRTRQNYQNAVRRLQEVLFKESYFRLDPRHEFWRFDTMVSVESGAEQLDIAIDELIKVVEHKTQMRSNSRVQIVKDIVKQWAISSLPFVALFLKIGQDASNAGVSMPKCAMG